VRLIRLYEGERLIGVEPVEPGTGDVEEDEPGSVQPESDSGTSEPPAPV
jgi:hypothetical protein